MASPLDRLTLLATFVRITERGNISAAARDLGLSQATASRQLAELEARLSAQLIERSTHSLVLTETGREVLADARALLEGWEALAERLEQDGTAMSGRLKVVVPIALGRTYLIGATVAFLSEYPNVSVSLILDDEPVRMAEVGCDLWIKIGRPADESLIVQELGHVDRLPVAAPTFAGGLSAKAPEALAKLPLAALAPFEGASIPLTGPRGQDVTVSAQPVLATNDIFSLKEAVLGGVAWAVLPRWLIASELQKGALVSLLPGWHAPRLTITAAFLPSRKRTRRVRAFIDGMATKVRNIEGVIPIEEPEEG